jgi:hypothetical protein
MLMHLQAYCGTEQDLNILAVPHVLYIYRSIAYYANSFKTSLCLVFGELGKVNMKTDSHWFYVMTSYIHAKVYMEVFPERRTLYSFTFH